MKSEKSLMKRRRYGWGWTPTTLQGWLFVMTHLGIIFAAVLMLLSGSQEPSAMQFIGFFIIITFVISSLLLMGTLTSPRPRWRWGRKNTDNIHEDF